MVYKDWVNLIGDISRAERGIVNDAPGNPDF
jgi:hypothetical protein